MRRMTMEEREAKRAESQAYLTAYNGEAWPATCSSHERDQARFRCCLEDLRGDRADLKRLEAALDVELGLPGPSGHNLEAMEKEIRLRRMTYHMARRKAVAALERLRLWRMQYGL